MAREISLSNQKFFVAIDKWLQIRSLFYPHVGQYDHLAGNSIRLGIKELGDVSYLNDDEWERDLGFEKNGFITDVKAQNETRGLTIDLKSTVLEDEDIFVRKLVIQNKEDHQRELELFSENNIMMHGNGVGDTAMYYPQQDSIIHYKRNVYLLLNFYNQDFEYDTGSVDIRDGLTNNPIAQGDVNSALSTKINLSPKGQKTLYMYIIAAEDIDEICRKNERFEQTHPRRQIKKRRNQAQQFLRRTDVNRDLLNEEQEELFNLSLSMVKAHYDKDGAIIASNDSDNMQFNKDTYSYMWGRDGALVAKSLIEAGYAEETKPFFTFCKKVMRKKGYLLHKYNPDGSLGSSWHPWIKDGEESLPIQEDSTALVLHALEKYYEETRDKYFIEKMYDDLIKPMSQFLFDYKYDNGLPKESYDLWEERRGIFTYTASTVIAGTMAAHQLGHLMLDSEFCEKCKKEHDRFQKAMKNHLYKEEPGYFRRSVTFEEADIQYDDTIDASVYGIFEFDVFEADDKVVKQTMEKVRDWLWIDTDVGGIARYRNDYYHQISQDIDDIPGNPWFITTIWYAKWVIDKADQEEDLEEAREILDWILSHRNESGVLSEMIHPHTGEPLSVSPLTWSHAEYVSLIAKYTDKLEELR